MGAEKSWKMSSFGKTRHLGYLVIEQFKYLIEFKFKLDIVKLLRYDIDSVKIERRIYE